MPLMPFASRWIARRLLRASSALALPLAAIACGGSSPEGPAGTSILSDWTGKSGFYGSPFPSDSRLTEDGTADLTGFPNPASNSFAARIVDLASKTRGFGTTTAVYFELDGPLGESLSGAPAEAADAHKSLEPASPLVLIGVDKGSPDYLRRYPITTRFFADGGPYGAPNLLALLPLQGAPLRPGARYAAAVRRSLNDSRGAPLVVSEGMRSLTRGEAPPGMTAPVFVEYKEALAALAEAEIPADDIAGLSVFTTGEPTVDYAAVASAMLALPTPKPSSPFVLNEVFDDYCVYETTIPMPVYQQGEPPYSDTGGGWAFNAAGEPTLQRTEEANFVVTVPRRPMPASGYPIVVLSRTGAGGERPLVDRGVQAVHDGPSLAPGTGPAFVFAKAGFAGASVDGPHGGLRNVTHGDEQFLVFNIGNPIALRDNVRQSAAELGLVARLLSQTTLPVADCPGAVTSGGEAKFDPANFVIMGHSMGASIIPLTAALEPTYKAMIQSGAGASFIANVIHKQKPIPTLPLAEVLIGVASSEYSLTEHDPLLNLLQWAGEPADVPPYAARIVREPSGSPRHVLTTQGIVDHYILPPISNPTALSLGLDLAGDALDESTPELSPYTRLRDVLDLAGRSVIPLPASGNVDIGGTKVTAVIVQHPEDGIEDGHEIVFQTEPPKHQIRCFLESLAAGAPRVPKGAKLMDPCE